jgi:hypothetical protein
MMRNFRYADIDARDLVRGLTRSAKMRDFSPVIHGDEIGRRLTSGAVRVLWSVDSPKHLDYPTILIGPEETLSSFLPKMLAVPGTALPATSLMRTWFTNDVENVDVFFSEELSPLFSRAFVGLMIGELMATAGPEIDLAVMGMDSVRRTLSFVCAQALMRGWKTKSLSTLVDRWQEASELTSNEIKHEACSLIAQLFEFLRAIPLDNSATRLEPDALARTIDLWIYSVGLHQFQGDFLRSSLVEVADSLQGEKSRERRFDAITAALQHDSLRQMHPLVHGFLLSLIEPGSLEFLEMAKNADRHGLAAIAYCLCAGLLGKDETLRAFNGFGLTVLNQGFRADVAVPVDMSIAELRILNDPRRKTPIRYRTRSAWLIDVELAPMISGSFGNVAKRRSSQSSGVESQTSARVERVRESLMEAMRALENAYGAIDEEQSVRESAGTVNKAGRR